MWRKFVVPIATTCALIAVFQARENQKIHQINYDINEEVERTAQFLIRDWKSDEDLKDIPPPQVIPVVSGSKIYGACGEDKSSVGNWEIGGSSYCGMTHSIYLVPEELKVFRDTFGVSSIAYVLSHEFGHALQAAFGVRLNGASRELQADCLAGVLIDTGNEALGITRGDILEMAQAAYSIGSKSHGSGPQRRYALLSGMGVLKTTCSDEEMQSLADGKIKDLALTELSKTRSDSGSGSININMTPYPKTFKNALGI